MTAISALKERIRVGNPIVRNNLTVFPLLDDDAATTVDYVPFGAAQRAEKVRITEVSAGGSVPQLAVETLSETPVLLLDGEELIGAMQNRIVNLTILVPGKRTIAIPVSCVERGRWSSVSPEFLESPQAMYLRARARKTMAVSAAMRHSGAHDADQGAVWEDVSLRMFELHAPSPTSAMGDIFQKHRATVNEYLDGVVWTEGQVGAAFAINGKPAGVEIFESQSIARHYLPKVVRSYALDAIAQGKADSKSVAQSEEVVALIDAICTADVQTFPSLGIGTDFRIDSPALTGAALVRDASVVHLSAFLKSITRDGSSESSGRTHTRRTTRPGTTADELRLRRPEGPLAETYPLEIMRNHMLMRVKGGLALIDTGSPVSIGRGSTLTMEGRRWNPSSDNASVLDALRQHLWVDVDWLIGYDILSAHRMLLDWRGAAVHVGRARTRHVVDRFPIEVMMGVPVIRATHFDTGIRAVIDSGAALSYAPRAAVAGLDEAGEYEDFYPGVGTFRTQTWSTRVRLGAREVPVRVGVLPEALQLLFGMLLGREGWIIGSEFFRGRSMLLDYRWQHILDLTDEYRD